MLFKGNSDHYEKYRGQEYYYIDSSQNLYFKSFHSGKYELIKDVDLNSFAFLANFYSYDKERIYHQSKCLKKGYTTFRDYQSYGYFKVDDILYWFGKKVKDNFTRDLINISEHFFTDNDKLFVNGQMFDFDKDSFSILNKFYAKDSSIVFHSDQIIDLADSETFRVIREDSGYSPEFVAMYAFLSDNGNSSWACDKNNLYFCGKRFLSGVIDPLTTRVIRTHVLIDKSNVFYHKKLVKGADPNTFQCIVDSSERSDNNRIKFFTSFFKDKENIFYLYEDEVSESKDEIIRCTPKNRAKYIVDLKILEERYSIYNLDISDVEKIKGLLR
jgi:hypothetical protein